MSKYSTVIWDWNGTLLNDIDASINSINPLLQERNLRLHDRDSYRSVFGFPVKEYYVQSGFDLNNDSWEKVAHDFIDNFKEEVGKAELFEDAPLILEFLKDKGIEQYILSAMEHNSLVDNVRDKGIIDFFTHICGIDNIYATSKKENGNKLIQDFNLNPEKSLFIGDTTHDFEVATSLGIDCALFTGGHQDITRLQETNCKYVLDNLSEVKGLFLG